MKISTHENNPLYGISILRPNRFGQTTLYHKMHMDGGQRIDWKYHLIQ